MFHTNNRKVILDRIACLIIGTILAILILFNGRSCAEMEQQYQEPPHSPTR